MADQKLQALKGLAASAPKSSAINPAPWELPEKYTDFLNKAGLTDGLVAQVMYGTSIAATKVAHTMDAVVFEKKGEVKMDIFEAKGSEDKVLDTPEKKATFRNIVAIQQAAIGWLVDLSACHQVKALSESNVENYFKMLNQPVPASRVLKVVDHLSRACPRLITAIPDESRDSKFITYHTTVASGLGLVRRYLNSLPPVVLALWTQAEIKTVTDYLQNPSDIKLASRIPPNLVVHSYIFHDLSGTLPSKWFMGIKEVNVTSVPKINRIRAFYKKMMSLSSAVTDIEGATTMDELAVAFPK